VIEDVLAQCTKLSVKTGLGWEIRVARNKVELRHIEYKFLQILLGFPEP
jgi:hypothetical protein